MDWHAYLSYLYLSDPIALLYVLLATYAFTIVTDFSRTILEVFFNFFRQPGMPPLRILSPEECAIVIPCHNSADCIQETLNTLPRDYKVYVVANACSDSTVAILKSLVVHPNLRIIETASPGKIRAVLLGALSANKEKYSHFLLLDDDVEWPADQRNVPFPISVYDKGKSITALPVVPSRQRMNYLRSLQTVEYQMMCASKRAQANLGNVIMASGAAGIYRLDTFLEAIKDHDGEHVGDDLQCSYIHHTKGMKIDFNSEVVVKTHPPETLGAWWKQRAKRWEASPVFNLAWAFRVIFAPIRGKRNPGWWIRLVTLYRSLVIVNDVLRCYSFPAVLIFSPTIILGIWVITYCSVTAKLLAFRYFFKNESYVKADGITLMSIVLYPLYGAFMWISRLRAMPKGIALNWKYYVRGSRKGSTLAASISTLEREIA